MLGSNMRTKTVEVRATSIILATLLVLSSLIMLIPVVPAHSQISGVTASINMESVTAGKKYGDTGEPITISVKNPPESTIAIRQVQIQIPDGWTDPAKTATEGKATVDADSGIKLVGYDEVVVGKIVTFVGILIPPGATGKFFYGVNTNNTEDESVTVPTPDTTPKTYEFKVWVSSSATAGEGLTLLPETVKVVVTKATKIEQVAPSKDGDTTTEEPYKLVEAGQSIEITFQLKDSSDDVKEAGVPIGFSFKDLKGDTIANRGGEEYKGTLSISKALTDSNGQVKVSLTVDTKVTSTGGAGFTIDSVSYNTWARIQALTWVTASDNPTKDALSPGKDSNTLERQSMVIPTKAGKASKLTLLPEGQDGKEFVTSTTLTASSIKVRLTDAYGNLLKTDTDSAGKEVTIKIALLVGTAPKFTGTDLDGGDDFTEKEPLPSAGLDAEVTSDRNIAISAKYGDSFKLIASVTIGGVTYSGEGPQIITSTFATLASITPSSSTSVEAGKDTTITVTLDTAQENVPVNIKLSSSDPGYAGTFDAVEKRTKSDGTVEFKLKVDTKKDMKTKVKATISKPKTTDITNTFDSQESAFITTIAGALAKWKVELSRTKVTPSDNLVDVTVKPVDAFGNERDAGADIAVALSVNRIAGEAGNLYLSTLTFASKDSSKTTKYAAGTTVGSKATIRASGAGFTGESDVIETIDPRPIVRITVPPFVNTPTTTFKVDIEIVASGATISKVERSLDGGAFTEITGISGVIASFSFELPVADGSHTIAIRVTDSANNVRTESATFFVDTVKPVITITSPAAGAKIIGDLMLEATVSDPSPSSGIDINSLVVKVDGNVVTATITDGKVTYRATLAIGSHTLTIDIKDKAGNSASTASVSFTIEAAVAGTATFAKPDVVETTGTDFKPAPVKPNTAFFVHAKYSNKGATPQEVIMYVQIKDAAGTVVFISALKTTVGVGASAEAFLGPAAGLPAGSYKAESFIWDAKTLSPLGEKGELTIVIS
ncbi:MAG: Ig-like domain-containing protein [Nitrososphaerales archaeon]